MTNKTTTTANDGKGNSKSQVCAEQAFFNLQPTPLILTTHTHTMMISSPPSKQQQQQFPLRQKSRVIPIRPWRSNHGSRGNDDANDDDVDQLQPLSQLAPPDYAMIELNGELLPPVQYPTIDQCRTVLGNGNGNNTSGSGSTVGSSSVGTSTTTQLSAQQPAVELGQLQLDGDDTTPVMILGSHQLKGKIEKLKEPFCLMEKVYNKENQSLEAYQVVGIVKQKYLFSQYPKVIMR